MPGVGAPAASCAKGSKKCARVFTASSPDQPGIPARDGWTAYIALSLAIGLLNAIACGLTILPDPVEPNNTSAGLDARNEASGPHDFTDASDIVVLRAVDRSRRAIRPAIPPHA
jgi:hypothetical protein